MIETGDGAKFVGKGQYNWFSIECDVNEFL